MTQPNKLRRLREAAGLSQGELADRIGSFQTKISAWESGARGIPLDKAILIAHALDCFLTELRPDLLKAKSIDVMLQGAPKPVIDDVRNYALFRLSQGEKPK
jgi:transcriptional regulator with XRE-family HTH domain